MNIKWKIFFGLITFTILGIGAYLFYQKGMYYKSGNEIGDFLSGFMASLILLWTIPAVLIQSSELALQRKEIVDLTNATKDQAASNLIIAKIQANSYLSERIKEEQGNILRYHKEISTIIEDNFREILPVGAVQKPFFYWLDILGQFVDRENPISETHILNQNENKAKLFRIKDDYKQKDHIIMTDLIKFTDLIHKSIQFLDNTKKEFQSSNNDLFGIEYSLDEIIFKDFNALVSFTKNFTDHIEETLVSRFQETPDKYRGYFTTLFIEYLKANIISRL